MSDFEVTDRGFKHFEPIKTNYGHTVRVYESSAAMQPCLWMAVERAEEDCIGGLEPESAHVHMTIEEAEHIRDSLDACIKNHYQQEG